eukprot:15346836-Alexandrium_andersonii.AAC.1
MFIPGDFSVPGRRETNGIAEGCVKKLSRCVRALLEQSGLEHAFWPWAGRTAAFALNQQSGEGKSPYQKKMPRGKLVARM